MILRYFLPPLDPSNAARIREQIDAQYRRARSLYRLAPWLERFGLAALAHKQRHEARLALRMAAKMQRGLDSGAYLLGRRQFPHVEDQCGCARYCRRGRGARSKP